MLLDFTASAEEVGAKEQSFVAAMGFVTPKSWRGLLWDPWQGVAFKRMFWGKRYAVTPLLTEASVLILDLHQEIVLLLAGLVRGFQLLPRLCNYQLKLRVKSLESAFDASREATLKSRERHLAPMFVGQQAFMALAYATTNKALLLLGALLFGLTMSAPWVCGRLFTKYYNHHRTLIVLLCHYVYFFATVVVVFACRAYIQQCGFFVLAVGLMQVPCRQFVFMLRFQWFLPVCLLHAITALFYASIVGFHGAVLAALLVDAGMLSYTFISELKQLEMFFLTYGAKAAETQPSFHPLESDVKPEQFSENARFWLDTPAAEDTDGDDTGWGPSVAVADVPQHVPMDTEDTIVADWPLSDDVHLGLKFPSLEPMDLPHNLFSTLQSSMPHNVMLFEGCIHPGCVALVFPGLLWHSARSTIMPSAADVAQRVKDLESMSQRSFTLQLGSQIVDVRDGVVVPRATSTVPRVTAVLPAVLIAGRRQVVTVTCSNIACGSLLVLLSCGGQTTALNFQAQSVQNRDQSVAEVRLVCEVPKLPAGSVMLQVCNEGVYSNTLPLLAVNSTSLAHELVRAGLDRAYTSNQPLPFVGNARRALLVFARLHRQQALQRALAACGTGERDDRARQLQRVAVQLANTLQGRQVPSLLAFLTAKKLPLLLDYTLTLAQATYSTLVEHAADSCTQPTNAHSTPAEGDVNDQPVDGGESGNLLYPRYDWDEASCSLEARAFVRIMEDVQTSAADCGILHLAIKSQSTAALCTLLRWSERFGLRWNWHHRGQNNCMDSSVLGAVASACSHSVLLPLAVLSCCPHAAAQWTEPCLCEGQHVAPAAVVADCLTADDRLTMQRLVDRGVKHCRTPQFARGWFLGFKHARLEQVYCRTVGKLHRTHDYLSLMILIFMTVSRCRAAIVNGLPLWQVVVATLTGTSYALTFPLVRMHGWGRECCTLMHHCSAVVLNVMRTINRQPDDVPEKVFMASFCAAFATVPFFLAPRLHVEMKLWALLYVVIAVLLLVFPQHRETWFPSAVLQPWQWAVMHPIFSVVVPGLILYLMESRTRASFLKSLKKPKDC